MNKMQRSKNRRRSNIIMKINSKGGKRRKRWRERRRSKGKRGRLEQCRDSPNLAG